MSLHAVHVTWDEVKEYRSDNVWVTKLRRRVRDLDKSMGIDFRPYEDLPSLFQHMPSGGEVSIVHGTLCSFEEKSGATIVQTRATDHGTKSCWRLEDSESPYLTVWRVDGALDALQVSVRGKDAYVYMQTGGARLLDLFRWATLAGNSTVLAAQEAFLAEATGS